jgi:hypothetical protein
LIRRYPQLGEFPEQGDGALKASRRDDLVVLLQLILVLFKADVEV